MNPSISKEPDLTPHSESAALLPLPAGGGPVMGHPELKLLFTIFLQVSESLLIGQVPTGVVRRLTPVETGRFSGDRLSGRVVSGADAVTVREDGCARIDARCVLETDLGEAIYMTYQGMRNVPTEPGGSEYFRCAFQFEAASDSLRWVNDIVAVGTGRREPEGPWYDVYELT